MIATRRGVDWNIFLVTGHQQPIIMIYFKISFTCMNRDIFQSQGTHLLHHDVRWPAQLLPSHNRLPLPREILRYSKESKSYIP